MSQAGLYLVLNMAAAALNYSFQLLAARDLSREQFGAFSTWFAWLSLALVAASFIQYAVNFGTSASMSRRRLLMQFMLGVLVVTWAVSMTASPTTPLALGASAVVIAALLGWTCGQAQVRLMLVPLALSATLIAAVKVLLVLIPPGHDLVGPSHYQLAMTLAVLPALAVLSLQLARTLPAGPHTMPAAARVHGKNFAAPMILAIAAAALPQVDLLALSLTSPPNEFEDFARTSLFTKAVFFLFLLGAQWFLPHQVRDEVRPELTSASIWRIVAVAFATVLLLAWGTPYLSDFLGWSAPPPFAMVVLACSHMALLSGIYFGIQLHCVTGAVGKAVLPIVAVALVAGLQLILSLGANGYLALAIGVNSLVLAQLLRSRT